MRGWLLNENIYKFITTHINIKTSEHHQSVFTSMEKNGALLTSYNKHKRKKPKKNDDKEGKTTRKRMGGKNM